MKKSLVLAALLLMAAGSFAQTMKVQSAYSDMKNDRLRNAMENIEEACVHEKTKDDAKTWYYAGLIYAKFVELSQSTNEDDQKLLKKQKVKVPIDELADKAQNALIKSIEIEKANKTNEYISVSNGALMVIAGYQLQRAIDVFNEGKYQESIPLLEKTLQAAEVCQYKEVVERAKLIMAMAYDATNQKDKAAELYRELVKGNTKEREAYINLFVYNQQAKEMDKAINVLKKGVKVLPKDSQLKALLASSYISAGNNTEAEKLIQEILALGADNPENLNYVGGIYRDAGDMAKAEEYYNKS
ncbi:MAG TPA: tetratricopeptide repeat protein, partial [Candidatus Onthomorpha intestinigallinarum]|nr:tetratricopeptide repeat protein [Candidatus Onthomorpha intestinigallinarum]